MNIDELRSVQNREREAASLQNLRPTFYEDAGSFIADLEAERDRAAERADDPFASPDVRRLTDDIETAKSTVEAIYERRVGKVVKMASIAAAEMPTEEENLTNEERDLFAELVERITENREHVLDGVLEGDGPGISCSRDAPAGEAASRNASGAADAADALDATDPEGARGGHDRSPDRPGDLGAALEEPSGTPAEADAGADAGSAAPAGSFMGGEEPGVDDAERASEHPAPPEPAAPDAASGTAQTGGGTEGTGPAVESADSQGGTESLDRSLVRITADVGEIFGVDDRAYELSADEVVTLPEANADPLVERGAAERLE